jgi:hypothetical protein
VLIGSVQAGASGLVIVIRRADEAVDRGSISRLLPRMPICMSGGRIFISAVQEREDGDIASGRQGNIYFAKLF